MTETTKNPAVMEPTALERAGAVPAETRARIEALKAERDAVILAHYYVEPEVQAVAD